MVARTSRVLHRSLRETPPKAIGGEGVYLFAEDGRRVIDASGGAAVSCLGHQHPRVIAAMAKQASTLAYAHTAFFSSEPAEALAEADVLAPADPPAVQPTSRDEALTWLFALYHRQLVGFAMLLVDDRATAEDVVQDAFLALHRRWTWLRDSQAAYDYLRTAVLNGIPVTVRPAPAPPEGSEGDDRLAFSSVHQ